MRNVLTLIADPNGVALTAAHVKAARHALSAAGAQCEQPQWLDGDGDGGAACDIAFDKLPPQHAEALARSVLLSQPFDIVAQANQHRRKHLLVADMDSTIISVECIDELAAHAGKRAEIAAITERAMRGELDFVAALKQRVASLRGLDASVFATVYAERVRANPGARALVATMRAHGALTALVSGGFTEFTARVRQAIGFDLDQANRLVVEGGKLTGQVAPPILGADAKLAILRRLTAERGLNPAATLAVGDGANDLPMILAAGLGVAYRAKPKLAAAAAARVEHGDLTALLYMQGYRRDEFAA
jgi:phosphoserine phosphatase